MRTAHRAKAVRWRKSSYSNGQGGNCVQEATSFAVVPVRDAKEPNVGCIAFAPASWSALIAALRTP
ncbi:DUF397 domain-containing protein [Embleya sp. AB8]|uniref:DUF397 domain-containing protein n=1 Tax=Embleya sp. AB8 TaxID=3156304 RepID=UPI003C790720